ncbi:hypothetical protein, partial [Escherichia coli]|uniref:hypothetical protein n=1 Tax=Escherichia coli TaxID=562 RepID=UPI001F1E9A2C
LTALTAEFTVGEGKLMTHDEPCSMAPDDKHDLISGTCSHLPYLNTHLSVLVIRQKEFHGCVVIQPGTGRNLIKKNMILYMDITDNGLMMKYIFSAFRIVTDMN